MKLSSKTLKTKLKMTNYPSQPFSKIQKSDELSKATIKMMTNYMMLKCIQIIEVLPKPTKTRRINKAMQSHLRK